MNAVRNATNRHPVNGTPPKPEHVRNIGVAAHVDAGKTTLTERILFYTGAIHRAGDVDDGTTTTDFNPIEQSKGITIFAAAVSCSWTQAGQDGVAKLFPGVRHRLNVIDTPGHVDFTAEVERSLRVLDGMVAVFCAVAGVQPQSETVWRQADRYGVPRIAFINKMDRIGADFDRVVNELRKKLQANAAAVILPWGKQDQLLGQLDVVNERAFRFTSTAGGVQTVENVPPDWQEAVTRARADLIARVAEVDDEVATLWLAGSAVSPTVLKAAIRRATLANRFLPVIGGSAYRFIGVQPLLDAVVDYLPGPEDIRIVRAHLDDGIEKDIPTAIDGPAAALAFKVAYDDQGRRMVFLRVYAGLLRRSDRVFNARTGRQERLGRLVRLFAKHREDVELARPGDIVAAVGLDGFGTGDTLSMAEYPLQLERPVFPEPVVSMALEPQSAADRDRLAMALARLSDEDPTFRTYTDPDTGQPIIAGMGELHLEVIRTRLETDHGVHVEAGAPAIAYRETITGTAEADHLLKKQNGGVGMYARVKLAVRPKDRGTGVTVENRVTGGNIPAQYVKSVVHGVHDALRTGVLAGNPVVDVHVDILDGAAHAKDSSDLAFRLAAGAAVQEALKTAGPVLLEPIMNVEVDTPSEDQGDLLGDLGRRRASIGAMNTQRSHVLIQAHVPLAELWGYSNAIRSLSRGRAGYSMTPSHLERVPEALAGKVIRGNN
jgi:elongation factor G